MRRSDHAIPDVGRVNHAGRGRIFNRAVGQIGGFKREFIGKHNGFAVRAAVNRVVGVCRRIENRLFPFFAVELGLKPRFFINGF